MKTIKSSIIFLFIFFIIPNLAIPKEIEWEKLDSSWDLYLKHPSEKNANLILSLLPDSSISEQGDLKVKAKLCSNLDFLEQRIGGKDINALKLSFKLIAISDGGFTEELCIIIGNSIKLIPEEFLHILKSNMTLANPVLGSILTYYDFRRFKTTKQEKEEAFARINALKGVRDEKMETIKLRCIGILSEDIQNL